MSLHITKFVDRIRAAESRQQREVTMTINEARDLHTDITRLLLKLESATAANNIVDSEITEIKVSGGTFI
jgi:hypothetical protein